MSVKEETIYLVNEIIKKIDDIDNHFIIILGEIDASVIPFKYFHIYSDSCDLTYNYTHKKDVYMSDKKYGKYPHIVGTICVDFLCFSECELYILYLDKYYSEEEIFNNKIRDSIKNPICPNKYFMINILKKSKKFNDMITNNSRGNNERYINTHHLAEIFEHNDVFICFAKPIDEYYNL